MPSISFDIIYEDKDGMWEMDINGTQLPISYRAGNPTYRNTSILGERTSHLKRAHEALCRGVSALTFPLIAESTAGDATHRSARLDGAVL